jgi:uncharacterized repeat protein (TIGR03803 family)
MKCVKPFLTALLAISLLSVAQAQSLDVLHLFQGADGSNPVGSLVLSGSSLFGATNSGGNGNNGVLFRMDTNGGGFSVLHSFGGTNDGLTPYGGLIAGGSTLYGATPFGGTADAGTIFKINMDGTGYVTLHTFNSTADGTGVRDRLLLKDSTLYGTTDDFGPGGCGTVFKINTDGSGFNVLHSFSSMAEGYSYSGLTVLDSTLYGTVSGGTPGAGALFKINTDGTGYSVLHSFGGTGDGSWPETALTINGSSLYGTTGVGGSGEKGTVFKINLDGSGYSVLHSFNGSDGQQPLGELTVAGSTIYGTTISQDGGAGTVFEMGTDGTGFQILHAFTGGSDGASPIGGMTLSDSTLYGTALSGGIDYQGTVYALAIPEPSSFVLLGMGAISLAVCGWRRRKTVRKSTI